MQLALGSNETLASLDISGHGFGNFGAAILCKSLQVNCVLKRLWMDENSVTVQGARHPVAAAVCARVIACLTHTHTHTHKHTHTLTPNGNVCSAESAQTWLTASPGLQMLALALERNDSLHFLPTPILDIAAALKAGDDPKALTKAMLDIERAIFVNLEGRQAVFQAEVRHRKRTYIRHT